MEAWCEDVFLIWQFLYLSRGACPQPIKEEYLLTGPLEKTNEAYALAKIAGWKCAGITATSMVCFFTLLCPRTLYGPGDNYHRENSHVLPALIRRFHEAKESGA
jgi:GDP-L-fucose synthase